MKWALLVLLAQVVEVPKVPVLLRPHEYHGEEVTAKDGERWMGLVKEGSAYHWKVVRLRVALVNDPLVDGPNGKTGKEVSVAGPEPVVLLPLSFGLERVQVSEAKLPVEFEAAAGRAFRLECRRCQSARVIPWEGEAQSLRLVAGRGKILGLAAQHTSFGC